MDLGEETGLAMSRHFPSRKPIMFVMGSNPLTVEAIIWHEAAFSH